MIKVNYSRMGQNNTHTREQVKELIKNWDEDRLFVQFGFGWKGARPRKVKDREEALNYGFFDAFTDDQGNLVLVEYGENDFY